MNRRFGTDLFCSETRSRRWTSLHTLNLSDNRLNDITEGIGDLVYLRSIDFSQNKLKGLPRSMESLSRLSSLKVQKNAMSFLPLCIIKITTLQARILSPLFFPTRLLFMCTQPYTLDRIDTYDQCDDTSGGLAPFTVKAPSSKPHNQTLHRKGLGLRV
jgi:hypothetical protein